MEKNLPLKAAVTTTKQRDFLFGKFHLQPDKQLLTQEGRSVHLANRPFQVLLYLLENRDRVVSKNELLDRFWDGHDVYEVALSKCIGAIRKALGDKVDTPTYIETRWAGGYRYIGPLEEDEPGTDIGSHASSVAHKDIITDSIAVLPFLNLSADPENEFFCDGLAEELSNALARVKNLKVAARTSAYSFKNRNVDASEIGSALRVNSILEGSVRKVGDRIRITAQLINVSDGFRLWSDQYDRQLTEIFDIQEEISLAIVKALRVQMFQHERDNLLRRGTENAQAYQLYLRGRFFWHKRTAEALTTGLDHFNQAVQHDPNYAIAHTGVSDSYTLLVVREAITPEDGFAKAKAAAVKALEIDPHLAEAHASLGHALLHNFEWKESERELRTAMRLNARYASAHHWYSEYLTAIGRFEESIEELSLAGELDPLSLIIRADLGRAFYYARKYDRVFEHERGTLEMDPTFWLSHLNLGRSFTQKGMHEEAIGELGKALKLLPENTEILSFLSFAYAAAGKWEEAQEQLEYLDRRAEREYIPPYHFAIIHTGLRNNDQAFHWLETAFEKRAVDLFTLKIEPMFDTLRGDPRFAELLLKIGFPNRDL
jgi:TolB-like protein/Tfp pilus assembly protein PilF